MEDLATAKARLLAKVEGYAPGQAVRFTPALDELIRWSEENGLRFAPHAGVHHLVKFCVPGRSAPFWAATPRTGDGCKLTLLADPRFPEPLRTVARTELARIDWKPVKPDGPPEVAFTKLIWPPHRAAVLALMTQLLAEIAVPATAV
ncbi:MAG: hypothetical protein U0871_24120 [Gemmataceae bacterium]